MAIGAAKGAVARRAGRRARCKGASRTKGLIFPPTPRVCMRGCTGTWACTRARACACWGHGHSGDRDGDSDTTARMANAQKETREKSERGCARGDDGGGTCNKISQPSSKASITSSVRGGVVADTAFPLGSKAGASTNEWEGRSSPWWPLVEVKASVKRRGAACRRGRRRRWRRGCRRRGCARRQRVRLLLTSCSGLRGGGGPTDGSPPPC
jgi:hypothetical protein